MRQNPHRASHPDAPARVTYLANQDDVHGARDILPLAIARQHWQAGDGGCAQACSVSKGYIQLASQRPKGCGYNCMFLVERDNRQFQAGKGTMHRLDVNAIIGRIGNRFRVIHGGHQPAFPFCSRLFGPRLGEAEGEESRSVKDNPTHRIRGALPLRAPGSIRPRR